MAWPKLYNVVKYRNELSSAGKIYLNNKLVSSAVIQSENANESTQIYNKKKYIFWTPSPHQLKFVTFFPLNLSLIILLYNVAG